LLWNSPATFAWRPRWIASVTTHTMNAMLPNTLTIATIGIRSLNIRPPPGQRPAGGRG
jgi:hypothetical protein